MPLELLYRSGLVGHLHLEVPWIGLNHITPGLQFQGSFQAVHLDLPADALSSLAPLQLYCLQAVPGRDILCHPQAGVLYIHLHQDLSPALMEAPVGLDPPVHLRGSLHPTMAIQHQLGVHSADVLPADDGDAGYSGTDGKVLPVLPGDISRSQSAGEYRKLH